MTAVHQARSTFSNLEQILKQATNKKTSVPTRRNDGPQSLAACNDKVLMLKRSRGLTIEQVCVLSSCYSSLLSYVCVGFGERGCQEV